MDGILEEDLGKLTIRCCLVQYPVRFRDVDVVGNGDLSSIATRRE